MNVESSYTGREFASAATNHQVSPIRPERAINDEHVTLVEVTILLVCTDTKGETIDRNHRNHRTKRIATTKSASLKQKAMIRLN